MSVFKAFRLEKHSMIKVESYKLDNENFAGKTRRPCLINLSIFICLFLKTAVKILPILFIETELSAMPLTTSGNHMSVKITFLRGY